MYKHKFMFFCSIIIAVLLLSGCVGVDTTCATCGPLPPFGGSTNEDVLKYLQTVVSQYNICNGIIS